MTLPLFTFDLWVTILLDTFLWFIFHMGFAKLAILIPDLFFEKPIPNDIKRTPFKTFFLEKIIMVPKWKKYSPDGGAHFKDGFSKRYLKEKNLAYYEKFLIETRRAEFTHYLQMLPAPIFFLFNPIWVGWLMIGYAILFNLPFIWIQKYNQPRMIKLIIKTKARLNSAEVK